MSTTHSIRSFRIRRPPRSVPHSGARPASTSADAADCLRVQRTDRRRTERPTAATVTSARQKVVVRRLGRIPPWLDSSAAARRGSSAVRLALRLRGRRLSPAGWAPPRARPVPALAGARGAGRRRACFALLGLHLRLLLRLLELLHLLRPPPRRACASRLAWTTASASLQQREDGGVRGERRPRRRPWRCTSCTARWRARARPCAVQEDGAVEVDGGELRGRASPPRRTPASPCRTGPGPCRRRPG